jgi:hypothetical protein
MPYKRGSKTAGFGSEAKDKLQKEKGSRESRESIENHIQAAEHFSMASKHHYEAVRYHEEGNHEKASASAYLAYGHAAMGQKYQQMDAGHHALIDSGK